MPVWQGQDFLDPLVTISTLSKTSMGGFWATSAIGTANWPAANRAIYVPCRLLRPTLCAQLWWYNGTKSGTPDLDCGIYAANEDGGGGRRIVSTGTTAQGTGSVIQAVDVTDTWLAPGLYFLALVMSVNSSGIFRGIPGTQPGRLFGMAQEALGSTVLPATMTPSSIASNYLPIFGFTSRTVI